MNHASSALLILKLPVWRGRVVLGLLLLSFATLVGRSLYLQGLNNEFLRSKGDARSSRVIELSAHRGMITDRWGEPLAISTPVASICATPVDVSFEPGKEKALAKLLGMNVPELQKRLEDYKREFVYIKRQLPPEVAAQAMQLGIPGVFLQREYRRYYPAGEVLSHVLGFTGVDDNGQEGLELSYQNWLAGKPGSRRVIKDRLGHIIEDVESIRVPEQGRDLALSIDLKIQYLAYRELEKAVTEHKAKAGGIVILDARTGELLALANMPTYNPNNRGKMNPDRRRNRVVTDLFEPGSTMKPFTAAAGLESGLFKPGSTIQTSPGHFSIGPATIHDAHPEGLLTVSQIIQRSSNIGAAKMALAMSPEYMWNMFNHAGFGSVPHTGFPGEASGKLRPFKTWLPIEQATMSYGHGISVSLLQLARAYTVFANDGALLPVTMIKQDMGSVPQAVFSATTARSVRDMLELVVQAGGTAPRARVAGYRVAGKTGTAHKRDANGGYGGDRYVASFVGLAPASDPRLIIAVMIDEPSDGQYYGGAVAAPVFSSVMSGALRMLSVPPDAPLTDTILPPESVPEVKEVV